MMKLPIKKCLLFFSTLVFFVACQVGTPKDIIQPGEMKSLLYDYHIVQAMGSEVGSASEYQVKLYYEYVFKKHGVSKELFDSSMVWYTRHQAYLTQIYADLQDRLDYEVAQLEEDKVLSQVVKSIDVDYSKDTVELWSGRTVNKLNSAPLNNKMLVSFASDTAFVAGDSVAFGFNTRFFSRVSEPAANLYATVMLTYTDNTTQSAAVSVSAAGEHIMSLPRDYDRTIKSVDAFIYYTDNDKEALSGVLLSGISLVRIHPPLEDVEEAE